MTDDRATADGRKLLTYADVAEMLAVDVRTVYRLRSAGKLRPVTLGPRIVRFRREDIDRIIAKGRI